MYLHVCAHRTPAQVFPKHHTVNLGKILFTINFQVDSSLSLFKVKGAIPGFGCMFFLFALLHIYEVLLWFCYTLVERLWQIAGSQSLAARL